MTEPPEGYRYCEPPSPGTVCQHKLCPGHERIAKWEAEQEDLRAMIRESLEKPEHEQQRLMDDFDRKMKTPEYWRNERADTEMEIEVMKSFLDGRGPFPVAEFFPSVEEMSQAEIRDLAAGYLEALREDLEMIDKMIAEILGKSRG